MELTKTARLTTKLYGTSPAIGYDGVLGTYVQNKSDKALLTFAQQATKKGQEIEKVLTDILKVLHRDEKGHVYLGGWMVRQCLVQTAFAIFNASKNKAHPKKDLIKPAIGMVTPHFIYLKNGKKITKPDGVDPYGVTKTEGYKTRSFFAAYEYINPGAEFKVTMVFDEELISKECVTYLLSKCGNVGTGAFRDRFGKYIWIK